MKSLAVARNMLLRIAQDRRTLLLIALIPLLFVLLYGYSFSGSPHHLRILVVNLDNGLASVQTRELGRITLDVGLANTLISKLDTDLFDVEQVDEAALADRPVGQNGVWASIVFPQNFSHTVVNTVLAASGERTTEYNNRTIHLLPSEGVEGPQATLRLDDSNPVIAKDVLLGLKDAFSAMLAGQQTALSADSVLTVDSVYGGTVRMMDYTAPGIIGFAMTLITVLLTSVSIVRERTGGTLTRLLIAPIRPWQATFGYTTAFVAIALFQVGELFLVSALLFSIRIVGSLGLIALIVVLFAIGLQGIATLVSTAARNEFQAIQFLLFLIIPSLMLSGVFWPIEALPQSMRYASYVSPLTFANNALREVMLKGGGWSEISLDVAVLAGFALIMLGFAVVSMRRQAYSA